ncbi:phosphoglycolate phosphatase [Lachnospiraceae bacterium KH1T2]|nr:phosphoglycolate phosphatase [Lachnospiraceae bacterium KH1T2]
MTKNNNNLAVLFPGIGYNNDRPLLYYAKRIAKQKGYDIIAINYTFPNKAIDIKGNADKMRQAFELAILQASSQLEKVDFSNYDRIIFIGKSIGTAVAAYYDMEHEVNAEHVVFTPVPYTFENLRRHCGIVFHGTSDPWCDTGLVEDKCREFDLDLYKIKGANHSLETSSIDADIKNLAQIVEYLEDLF